MNMRELSDYEKQLAYESQLQSYIQTAHSFLNKAEEYHKLKRHVEDVRNLLNQLTEQTKGELTEVLAKKLAELIRMIKRHLEIELYDFQISWYHDFFDKHFFSYNTWDKQTKEDFKNFYMQDYVWIVSDMAHSLLTEDFELRKAMQRFLRFGGINSAKNLIAEVKKVMETLKSEAL
jgi:tyrosine-protein phosphatase YwqE